MRIFNKFLKKKLEFEVDLYTLKNGDSTPFMLDAKLSVNKNEINISNSSKKCTFYAENIYDFKYHEIDMCHFKYLCKNVIEEYGLVFADISGMYNFYKYVMYTYLKGNIILCRNVNLYKYENFKKILYKKNYYGVLIFNTDKCEHLLIVVKSNREEKQKVVVPVANMEVGREIEAGLGLGLGLGSGSGSEVKEIDNVAKEVEVINLEGNKHDVHDEKREDIHADKKKEKGNKNGNNENDEEKEHEKEEEKKNAECEIYYKEVTIENLKQLYKRNKIFLVYVLNTYNDVYLSNESIGIHTKKYIYKNCYKRIEYKGLYSDAESYMRFFAAPKSKGKDREKRVSKVAEKGKDSIKQEKSLIASSSPNRNENAAKVIQKEASEEEKNGNIKAITKGTSDILSTEKSNLENETKKEGVNIETVGGSGDERLNEILKWNAKVLITFDSESILIDYIQKILMYRYDFKDDVLNIREDYLNTQTTIGFNNKNIDVCETAYGKEDMREEDSNDEKGSESHGSDSEEEVDAVTGNDSDMKYKHVNVAGNYSFVLRQNRLIPKKKKHELFRKSDTSCDGSEAISYDDIKNDLNIYLFDEYGKEKRTYNSDNKLFKYKDEKYVPKDFQVHDNQGNKLIFLDEQNDTNLFMVDVNREQIVKKWDTEYVPIEKLLKKRENVYLGYNKNSLYYVDTRIKDCVQNMVQYRSVPYIKHAAIDDNGHIVVMNQEGELKYYDGELNVDGVIKRCKNVIYCANDVVHITTTKDGSYSIITCGKSIMLCHNYVDKKMLFEWVIKVADRVKQKKICLQLHYCDVFANELGDFRFIRSDVSDDNAFIFTFAQNFYVIWNFKEALNGRVSYVIKKTTANISDLSLFNVNDVQGVVVATEDKLTAKKITERTIKQLKAPQGAKTKH